jgi:hypothetical protein
MPASNKYSPELSDNFKNKIIRKSVKENLFLTFLILFITICIIISIKINQITIVDTSGSASVKPATAVQHKGPYLKKKLNQEKMLPAISANLIYEDGTMSDFDIVDNEDINLWNTNIGEGSAVQSSNAIQIIIQAGDFNIDSLSLKVATQDSLILESQLNTLPVSNEQRTVKIDNTGCSRLTVSLMSFDSTVLEKQIPFTCGE